MRWSGLLTVAMLGAVAPAALGAGEEPPRVATVATVGDIMPGAYDYGLPSDGGRGTFAGLGRSLDAQLTLGNLEGALTRRASSKCAGSGGACYVFRMPSAYAPVLRRAGFDVLNLANNHALDAGYGGLRDTQRALRAGGIRPAGVAGTITRLRAGELDVAVVGFGTNEGGNRLTDVASARALVRRAGRRADIVIVTFHGGAEGAGAQRVPPASETFLGVARGNLRSFAHAVVDAGADLVVGHGPHVLRGMEVRRGRLIAYSLGNFVGYRAFNLRGPNGVSTVLRATLDARGCLREARAVPARLTGFGRPQLGGQAVSTLRRLSQLDFGPRAPWIAPDGRIAARNPGPCRTRA